MEECTIDVMDVYGGESFLYVCMVEGLAPFLEFPAFFFGVKKSKSRALYLEYCLFQGREKK
jgi:hypothetical protein